MTEKPRLLATGFGPFLTHEYNPSWVVAEAFCAALGDVFDCRAERLEVTYRGARHYVEREFGGSGAPRWVVHFGLAAGTETLRFERLAFNRRGDAPDASVLGVAVELGDRLDAGGPGCFETSVDTARLVALFEASEAARALDIRAVESLDAGDYVCNAIYYHALRAAEAAPGCQVLFVHVPTLDAEQAALLGEAVAGCFRAAFSA